MANPAQSTSDDQRTAFNKENPTDLLMQLVKVFAKAGLDDEAQRIRTESRKLQTAWKKREKLAALHEAKRDLGISPYKKGALVTSTDDFKVGDLLVIETKIVGVRQQLARVMKIGDDSFDILYVDPEDPSKKRRLSDRPVSVKVSQLKEKRQFSKAKKAAEANTVREARMGAPDPQSVLTFLRMRSGDKIQIESPGLRKSRAVEVTGSPKKDNRTGWIMVEVTSGRAWGSNPRGGILQYREQGVVPMTGRDAPEELIYQATLMQSPMNVTKLKKISEQQAEKLMHASTLIDTAIKLAHGHPEHRRSLLAAISKVALGLGVGNKYEDERSMLRLQRGMSTIRVTDLTNAGKRGKKVDEFAVWDLDYATDKAAVDRLASQLARVRSYSEAKSLAEAWVEYYSDIGKSARPKIEYSKERGVDVTPAGFKPVKILGKEVEVEADYTSFTVRDVADKYNLSTCIPAIKGGKKDIKVFYRWVSDNEAKIKNMKFGDVVKAMMQQGIKFHQYCAMD